jgi:glutathione synthase
MGLKVAIQMDPIGGIDINGDSTFMMALEAQARGHSLLHYVPKDLSLHHNRAIARVQPLTVRREIGNHATLGEMHAVDLADVDVVLMRQDPPFDMNYITATHILDHVHPQTLVVNDPKNVRNAPEKLLVTYFPDLMPPTLITGNPDDVLAFRREHKDIIVKPLYGNGGAGVFHIPPGDENLGVVMELFAELYVEPFIVQRYLPEVRAGDKRIIIIDGEPVGAVTRMPAEGDARANFHAGGQALAATLNTREQEICEAIAPTLREQGLIFVGIDVIGEYLTEINVTSPTGIQEINRLSGTKIEANIWDAIERRLA